MSIIQYIYEIINVRDGKKYIGLTCNPNRRRKRHFSDLRCGVHDNLHLQRAFDRDGEDSFVFNIIHSENCTVERIGEKEKEFIQSNDSYLNGYNMNGGGFDGNGFVSRFSREDVFNILSTLQAVPRSGGILSEIYDTSAATISRIGKGETCVDLVSDFKLLTQEEQTTIFNRFDIEHSITFEVNKRQGVNIRRYSDEVYFKIIAYTDRHPRTSPRIAEALGCCASTVRLFIRGKTNADIHSQYGLLSDVYIEDLYSQAKKLFEPNVSLYGDI